MQNMRSANTNFGSHLSLISPCRTYTDTRQSTYWTRWSLDKQLTGLAGQLTGLASQLTGLANQLTGLAGQLTGLDNQLYWTQNPTYWQGKTSSTSPEYSSMTSPEYSSTLIIINGAHAKLLIYFLLRRPFEIVVLIYHNLTQLFLTRNNL